MNDISQILDIVGQIMPKKTMLEMLKDNVNKAIIKIENEDFEGIDKDYALIISITGMLAGRLSREKDPIAYEKLKEEMKDFEEMKSSIDELKKDL